MLFHNSQDLTFRDPPGARPAGTTVMLRVRADKPLDRAILRIWWDDREICRDMLPLGDHFYEYPLTLPDTPGLLFYYFIGESTGQRYFLGNAQDGLGGIGQESASEPPSYPITVCDPAFRTPDFLKDGAIMQIMVDRFFEGSPRGKKRLAPSGYYHASWSDAPDLVIKDGDNQARDFFGGDLAGLAQKLPYIASLGITVLYLNPIFESPSNHKYDTSDYKKIDPGFGTEADFEKLCEKAKALDIRILLDGVFSHTGADSRYFNRLGRFDGVGAYQSKDSPYASWYRFNRFPDDYDCWWGFPTLPNVDELSDSYLRFVIEDGDAVCARWLKKGASGWRLDVADELPMAFLRKFRARIKREDPDAALIGEVWEDPTNKVSYGELRNYALGDTLDSTMNYPLRDAVFDFFLGRSDAKTFARRLLFMRESQPLEFYRAEMNLLGSHDRMRAINALSGEASRPREERRAKTLSHDAYELGKRRYLAAWRLVCALPGAPTLYYGDEAGMTGEDDPFCRGAYPWGKEDRALQEGVRDALSLRKRFRLSDADFDLSVLSEDAVSVCRSDSVCVVNRGDKPVDTLYGTVPGIATVILEKRGGN